jgi:Terminase large subunit, T4likevirus-type, N-terminal
MSTPVPSSSRPPAVLMMQRLGLEPDPWQIEVLEAGHLRLLLNCCRQAGKSTVVGLLGLAEALFLPHTKVLLLSRSMRQAAELYRTVVDFHQRLGERLKLRCNAHELRLANGSRIVCLPCREDTVRGYSHVSLLVIDEAARVPDDLYKTVRPMLAVSAGKLICLSTPYGRRGFFWDAWSRGGTDWARIEIPAERIPRIAPEFLAQERRCLGESWYRQEYCCSFEALEGLVYPDFARCVVPGQAPAGARHYGGIDFGYRNPFAAVWGTLDRDDVLWLTGEHYVRQQDLAYHAERLPRRPYLWFADPSGAAERAGLCRAGFAVRAATNAVRAGIGAVSARLRCGTLRVVQGCCPNLLAEAALYRYGDGNGSSEREEPENEHNHALDALRYLIMGLDEHRLARPRPAPRPEDPSAPAPASPAKPAKVKRPWLSMYNEFLWPPYTG